MTKDKKELILNLLSNAYTETKENLERCQRCNDNQVYENWANNRMKLIEETYKEITNYD